MGRLRWAGWLRAGAVLALATSGCAWVERASVDSVGNEASAQSSEPSISGDGRYVAFESDATNLVADDTNDRSDVFLRDAATGTTTRVSVDSTGAEGNHDSSEPSISADGRYVAFTSFASNLVAGDTSSGDVFVHDTFTGTTTRVSVDSAGNQANNVSDDASMSGDGRYVAFRSAASNLVDDDTNEARDVFVRDTVAGTTTLISVNTAGDHLNANEHPAISASGRFVVFTSGPTGVFVRDMVAGTTTLVGVDNDGNLPNSTTFDPAISADGGYVAFTSLGSNLVAGDTNGSSDVFVRDTVAGTTTRVSVDSAGVEGDFHSGSTAISADGRYIVFGSGASNLVTDDTNGVQDIIVRANPQPTVTGVAPGTLTRGTTTPITITGSGFLPGVLGVTVTGNGGGVTISNVTVVSPTEITADATVATDATGGSRYVLALLAGTGPGLGAGASGICDSCLSVT